MRADDLRWDVFVSERLLTCEKKKQTNGVTLRFSSRNYGEKFYRGK